MVHKVITKYNGTCPESNMSSPSCEESGNQKRLSKKDGLKSLSSMSKWEWKDNSTQESSMGREHNRIWHTKGHCKFSKGHRAEGGRVTKDDVECIEAKTAQQIIRLENMVRENS